MDEDLAVADIAIGELADAIEEGGVLGGGVADELDELVLGVGLEKEGEVLRV